MSHLFLKTILHCLATVIALSWSLACRADDLRIRRERLASLSNEEKASLQRNQDRFNALPPEEQERLRRLHQKLSSHPESEQLLATLRRYTEWLKTLDAEQRAALLGLPPKDRIAKIQELRQQQQQRTFGMLEQIRLPREDFMAIARWSYEFVRSHQEELLKAFRPAARQQFESADANKQQRILIFVLLNRMRNGQRAPRPTLEEVQALHQSLSPAAQDLLREQRTGALRMTMVQRWIYAALTAKMLPPVSPEGLRRFYQEELTATEKEDLDALPTEQRQRQLRRLYYQHFFRGSIPVGSIRANRTTLPNRKRPLPFNPEGHPEGGGRSANRAGIQTRKLEPQSTFAFAA